MKFRIAIFLAIALLALPLVAQSHGKPADQAAPQQGEAPAHASGPPAEGERSAAKGEHEGGGNSLHEQERRMKQSAVVQWLGRTLGIDDPKNAYWVFVILNFLVVASVIATLLRRKLPVTFRSRTAAIQKGIEEARKASADASARLRDIEARLSRLDTEIAGVRSKAEQDVRAEEERLRSATEEEKRRIIESAEHEIDAASTAARRDLQRYAGELAVQLAQQKIRVSEAEDRGLVSEFATQLGRDGAKGGR